MIYLVPESEVEKTCEIFCEKNALADFHTEKYLNRVVTSPNQLVEKKMCIRDRYYCMLLSFCSIQSSNSSRRILTRLPTFITVNFPLSAHLLIMLLAVSYTHLDVYKRKIYSCRNSLNFLNNSHTMVRNMHFIFL